jgi:hypothetical protein
LGGFFDFFNFCWIFDDAFSLALANTFPQPQSHPHPHRTTLNIEAAEAKLNRIVRTKRTQTLTRVAVIEMILTQITTKTVEDQIERDQIKHQPNRDQEQSQFGWVQRDRART